MIPFLIFGVMGAPGILLARKEIFDKTNIGNNDLSIIKNVLTNVENKRIEFMSRFCRYYQLS